MSSRVRRVAALSEAAPYPWTTGAGDGAAWPTPRLLPPPMGVSVVARLSDHEDMPHDAHLAAIEREAIARGFAEGERAGTAAAAAQTASMFDRLAGSLEQLDIVRRDMIRATERQMVELAIAVARRIVHREVSLDADLLVAMARVALDRLGERVQATVRLHPGDMEAAGAARLAGLGMSVTVVPDAGVARGGCLVESALGRLDAGVDAQLRELARALLGDDAHGGDRGDR